MAASRHAVLVAVADAHAESGAPVSVATVAAAVDAPEPAVRRTLESLRELALVAAVETGAGSGRGYRPTVTARELLAMDVPVEDVLAVDPVDE